MDNKCEKVVKTIIYATKIQQRLLSQNKKSKNRREFKSGGCFLFISFFWAALLRLPFTAKEPNFLL